MEYNLMYEPWIQVQYLDGLHKKIGIRQALQDAKQIHNISVPVFHDKTAPMYKYLVTQLLTTIVMAAYFKEETDYAAETNEYLWQLTKTGINTPTIQKYCEFWSNRFNLFDEQRPFLQDISAASRLQKESVHSKAAVFNFVANLNPYAPPANQLLTSPLKQEVTIFDDNSVTLLNKYVPTYDEFAYIVLFHATIAFNGIQYFAASAGNACEFILREGKNLEETIILNCVPLTTSDLPTPDDPDRITDAPVWEWSALSDYTRYQEGRNLLAYLYMPNRRILGIPGTNQHIENFIGWTKTDLKTREGYSDELVKTYGITCAGLHPHALRQFVDISKKNEPQNLVPAYVTYYPKNAAWMHAITATRSLGNSYTYCSIMNQPEFFPYDTVLYYRLMHEKKAAVFGEGILRLPKQTALLLTPEVHNNAVRIQNAMHTTIKNLDTALGIMQAGIMPDIWEKPEAYTANSDTQIAQSLNDYFFNIFCNHVLSNTELATQEALHYLQQVALEYFDRKCGRHKNISLYTRVYNRLNSILNISLKGDKK